MTLRLDKVVKRVGAETHIYETSLTAQAGSINVLLGPTLCGKTSLLRLMAGLDRPTSGRILIGEQDVTGLSVRRRDVAIVYQQFINYPSFTVYENIASPLRRAGIAAADIDRRVREAAEHLHIEPYLDRLPAELSGGQQQRTALARALVKKAQLLLLDEPLVNLDYKLREELREDLRELFAESETIVVYATTEPLEALLLSGQVNVLDKGRVQQAGTTLDVYNHPANLRVGAIFSDPPMNLSPGEVSGDTLHLAAGPTLPLEGHLSQLADGNYTFGMRAPYLTLARSGARGQILRGSVEMAEVSGSETFIHVRTGPVSWVVQEEGVHSMSIGSEIDVHFDPANLFVFDGQGNLVAAPRQQTEADT
jgi:glycerol transport system ATP-binding protein